MEIKVLFNSEAISKEFSTGWGLSFLIDNRILFDTGEDGKFLINNMDKMKIDISLIEAIVISHDHWDHTGGLWEILRRRQNIHVYACPRFGSDFKNKVSESSAKYFEADNFTIISTGIYSTGEIIGTYKGKNISEQSLIVKTENGVSVITGCSHPGIVKILERVHTQLSIKEFYAVLGGFHLKDYSVKDIDEIVMSFKKSKVKQAGPTHCSGSNAERLFKEKYTDNFIEAKIGQVINI